MKKSLVSVLIGFLLGGSVVGVMLANPLGWEWLPGPHAPITKDEAAGAASHTGPSSPDARQAPPQAERTILYWRAPMDPTYVSDRPGKSPMGMDLIPVYEDEEDAVAPGAIRIDPVFVQNIGVQSEVVRRTDIPFTIRTVGTLTYDDSQIAWVNTKYEGWIERVYVNYVGEPVEKGQKLFEIYSPQLVTTQKEYLHALDYAERMEGSDYPEILGRARSLLHAARERLGYWDISNDQIEELAETRALRRTLAAVSPFNGVVVEKMDQALEGMFVRAGMNLYKVVDLSTVWLTANVYEHQVPWLRVGSRARIQISSEPGRTYTGRIRYLYPYFDEKTRTMKVSVELPNPGGRLRADMYAHVTFDTPSARNVVAVPEEAVIHSGERNVVVLDRGNGTFEVREATLGLNGGGLWEVKEGVNEGDRIVVSAQFLIDSESNLKEAIRKMVAREGQSETPDSPSTETPAHVH